MIIADIDPGGGHPFPEPTVGQIIGDALVVGSRTVVMANGRTVEEQDVLFWASAWQSIGGEAANGYLGLRYLLRQLEELGGATEAQPILIRWASTAQTGQYNVATPHDGWYVIANVKPDYSTILSGLVEVRMRAAMVAPLPSPLRIRIDGVTQVSTYTGLATPLVAIPIGASTFSLASVNRVGGEGTIGCSILANPPVPNPLPIVPGTLAQLHQGGVRVYDTLNTTTNPVPLASGFVHANWVRVYGTQHAFFGDCVVTNGLLLLLFPFGGSGPLVYFWNTQGTSGWQLWTTWQYKDGAFNIGALRSLALEAVSLQDVALTAFHSTSVGHWAKVPWRLQPGNPFAELDFGPLTQANSTAFGMDLSLAASQKIVYNEAAAQDQTVVTSGALAATPGLGFAAAFGTQANGPIGGWLYQNPPANQPSWGNASEQGFGDSAVPLQGALRKYAIFVVPFPTIANLQAEGEGGVLDAGWVSQADAGSSGGNAAKCASGTLSGFADRFGTSWVPPAGAYNSAFRMRVASAVSTTPQMQAGLWDATSSVFVPLASTIYAPSQLATGYGIVLPNLRKVTDGVLNSTTTATSATAVFTSADVGKPISGNGIPAGTTIVSITNQTTIVMSAAAVLTASGVTLTIGSAIIPTASHNMQFRAVTAATLATDVFVDEAALLPILSSVLGQGSFPGDVWSQFRFARETRLVRG